MLKNVSKLLKENTQKTAIVFSNCVQILFLYQNICKYTYMTIPQCLDIKIFYDFLKDNPQLTF